MPLSEPLRKFFGACHDEIEFQAANCKLQRKTVNSE